MQRSIALTQAHPPSLALARTLVGHVPLGLRDTYSAFSRLCARSSVLSAVSVQTGGGTAVSARPSSASEPLRRARSTRELSTLPMVVSPRRTRRGDVAAELASM